MRSNLSETVLFTTTSNTNEYNDVSWGSYSVDVMLSTTKPAVSLAVMILNSAQDIKWLV